MKHFKFAGLLTLLALIMVLFNSPTFANSNQEKIKTESISATIDQVTTPLEKFVMQEQVATVTVVAVCKETENTLPAALLAYELAPSNEKLNTIKTRWLLVNPMQHSRLYNTPIKLKLPPSQRSL